MVSIVARIRAETAAWSPWFKWFLIALFALYLIAWVGTICLSQVQVAEGITPLLPDAPEDPHEYAVLAESLLSGNGFANATGLETLRTPGYPVFLAAAKGVAGTFFESTLIQVLLVFAAAILTRKIGERFAGKTAAEIAAILLLANPVTLTLSLMLYSDTLFLFLWLLGFYLAATMENGRFAYRAAFVAIIFGAATYVRPIGFFALPVFAAPFLISRLSTAHKLKALGILICGLAVLLSPWAFRNYEQTGWFNFSSVQSFNLLWAVSHFDAAQKNISVDDEYARLTLILGAPPDEWRNLRLASEENALSRTMLAGNVLAYARWHVLSTVPFLFPSTIDFAVNAYTTALNVRPLYAPGISQILASGNWKEFILKALSQTGWKIAERLLWLALLVLAALGFFFRRRELWVWAFACIVLYLMLLCGPAAGPRYALQAWPFFFVLFAAGMTRLYELRPQRA